MPRGITDQFLHILEAEARRAWTVLALGALAFLAALLLADLADTPRFGNVTMAFAAAWVLATGLAAAWAWRAAGGRTRDLADRWGAWMKHSVGSATIAEIERKVDARDPPAPWAAGLLVALFLLANGVVFALLWAEASIAVPAAFAMAVANGVGVGYLLGTVALRLYWARSATAAAQELVGTGAIAVWGER